MYTVGKCKVLRKVFRLFLVIELSVADHFDKKKVSVLPIDNDTRIKNRRNTFLRTLHFPTVYIVYPIYEIVEFPLLSLLVLLNVRCS